VTITASHVADVPKYRTGSDVVLDQARSDVEKRLLDRQEVAFGTRAAARARG